MGILAFKLTVGLLCQQLRTSSMPRLILRRALSQWGVQLCPRLRLGPRLRLDPMLRLGSTLHLLPRRAPSRRGTRLGLSDDPRRLPVAPQHTVLLRLYGHVGNRE